MIYNAPICFDCKYFLEIKWAKACKAFPKGIPEEILIGTNSHNEIIKDQVGDYVYERK